ncbi:MULTISPECIES: hypothetical protein [unclassified Oceanobacter]|uniref:hypothetical protein n=1 Tax=unclassified Oceanobacter TaxID=2620260 RepID=UPI002734E328|nr:MULTISPECIES: hypothetical protein [unclassified Oceanobacter]MDP2610293.1 hypothetical protein [Oceanobacter sp. 1_MG-2023]MDP2613569.1 hypothetical protein [Oceanobacter sp. 2_MG-2023]
MSELYQTDISAHVEWADAELARSGCYRRSAGARRVETAAGASVIAQVDNGDVQRAAKAGVLELSMLPRTGYRGTTTTDLLAANKLPIPARPNTAASSANGECVLRLSQKEYWLLASPADLGAAVMALPTTGAETPDHCYPLFCMDSHAWLMLTGEHLSNIMSKLSGVDMRESVFPVGSIAQTSIARINAIMVRQQINGLPVMSILCDTASSDYLWTALMDAVQEFEGGAVGLDVLR